MLFLENPIDLIIPISFIFSLTSIFKVTHTTNPAIITIKENTIIITVFSSDKAERRFLLRSPHVLENIFVLVIILSAISGALYGSFNVTSILFTVSPLYTRY